MKKGFILSILIFLWVACTTQTGYKKQLAEADSLMLSRPDSAWQLLERITTVSLKNKADRAYYALLLTQARDKNYLVQTDDSLIQTAVHYYDSVKDGRMQAKAYFYWGCVCRDRNEQATALEKLFTALPFAQNGGDKILLGKIYTNMGYIYYLQEFYEKADSIYQQAEQISIQLKDSILWASSLWAQAKIQLYNKQYHIAEKKFLQAQNMLVGTDQKEIQANTASALSKLYQDIGNKKEALRYAKENVKLQRDTLHCYRAFLELGDAYYQVGQYDSATMYIEKSLTSQSPTTKEGAYMRLADIAEAQGNEALSLRIERMCSAYKDSANLSSQRMNIVVTEQKNKRLNQRIQYEYYIEEYQYSILILIFLSSIGFYLSHKYYQKRLQKQRSKAHSRIEEVYRKYQSSIEDINRKEEQIHALEKEIAQLHFTETQKGSMEEKLSELRNDYTDLLRNKINYSEVDAKIKRILADYEERGSSRETLTSEEWSRLIAEIDKKGIILELAMKHGLEEKEIYYCCLLITDFSIKERWSLLQYTRSTIYRVEKRISQKIGIPYEPKALQKRLKDIALGILYEK